MFRMQYSNDLQKYCEQSKCRQLIEYTKVKTGGNDPSISKKMQYARYVRGSTGNCTKILDQNGNILDKNGDVLYYNQYDVVSKINCNGTKVS
jgi:hypothetical protein